MRSLAMTGSTEIARGTAEGLGLGEWFDDSLKKNPSLVKQVQKAYTSTQGLIFPMTMRLINKSIALQILNLRRECFLGMRLYSRSVLL